MPTSKHRNNLEALDMDCQNATMSTLWGIFWYPPFLLPFWCGLCCIVRKCYPRGELSKCRWSSLPLCFSLLWRFQSYLLSLLTKYIWILVTFSETGWRKLGLILEFYIYTHLFYVGKQLKQANKFMSLWHHIHEKKSLLEVVVTILKGQMP